MSEKMTKLRRELFSQGMKQLASTYNLCLWPNGECKEQAIRAHSVQNKGVLESLCRDGHVVMPKLQVTLSNRPGYAFCEVGRNKATTFSGLCSYHDSELFRPIEINTIDLSNSHHLFLLSYRAVLKEAHATRKSAIDTQSNYLLGVERGLYPKDEPSAPGMLAVEQMMSAYLVEETKIEYEKAFLNKDWERVGHDVLEIDVVPGIAVNSMFSTDLWSEEFDSPAFVTLNVFPSNGKTAVVFSYLKQNRAHIHQAFMHILNANGHYREYELSKLILRKCENLVISPFLYDQFSEKQKSTIAKYFERNVAGHSYDMEDHHLFIFAPVSI
jgi:hypothetical protein